MSALPTRATLSGSPSKAVAQAWFLSLFDSVAQLLAAGTTGAGTASAAEIAAARNSLQIPLVNYLHNPSGAIYQRAIAATADDVYCDDRWYALTQTGTITPSQVSNPEDGYHRALRLTQSQASAQRMGRAQIVEGVDTAALRGQVVTAGGRFKSSTSQNLRLAILAWTGTEDAVTSDVVNSWTNASITTGNFFNSTTLTLVATNSTALTAATAATCSVSGTVPSGATNLIYLYWTEATAVQNVTLDAWAQRLVKATALVDPLERSAQSELAICRRFLPAFVSSSTLDFVPGAGQVANSTTVSFLIPHDVKARSAPTGVAVSASADFTVNSVAGGGVVGALTFISGGRHASRVQATQSGMTAGQAVQLYCTNASGYILFTGCEL